jgi:hypothetical protein
MNIIELHQDFSERYPYARSSEETTEKHCGQIDNITFEAAWDLVVSTLQRWNSQAIMFWYRKEHPQFNHPHFNYDARFLLLPPWDGQADLVKEVFFSGKPIVFTDLTNGGSALFCLSEYEDENETFELLFHGMGPHHNLAEMAKQCHSEVELYIKKE